MGNWTLNATSNFEFVVTLVINDNLQIKAKNVTLVFKVTRVQNPFPTLKSLYFVLNHLPQSI